MSIVKIPPERIERFSVTLHPEVDYVSGSSVTGSAPLRNRPSPFIKDIVKVGSLGQISHDPGLDPAVGAFNATDFNLVDSLKRASDLANFSNIEGVGSNVYSYLETYMTGVTQSPNIAANSKKLFITRFDPPFTLNDVSIEKTVIVNNLMTFYEPAYDLCEMAYTNYHTLNFMSAPETPEAPDAGTTGVLPDNSAIIYQNFTSSDLPRPYSPSGSFSVNFWIKPSYPNDPGKEFHAGTILHLSSTFAISLVSGSSKDQNNLVDGYRILLQLSHSADIAPRTVSYGTSPGSYPRNLIFLSPDNSLKRNNWHNVTIRWGTKDYNNGTGSFVIDSDVTNFNVYSASILPPKHISNAALLVGNYFEGSDNEAKFFNNSTISEGVQPTLNFGAGLNVDPVCTLRHPLNGEIHDIKIYKKHLSADEIRAVKSSGPESLDSIMFYVPPHFIPEAPKRDMLITPFQTENRKPDRPFNKNFSFGVGGFIMNLENHVRDLVTKNSPRLFHLTASTLNTTVVDITANDGYIYVSGSTKKRNLTILPCDNGKFKPNFILLNSGTASSNSRKRKRGGDDLSVVSLENMIHSSTIYPGLPTTTAKDMIAALDDDILTAPDDLSKSAIAALVAGVTPESMKGNSGPILTIAQRTRDLSSNEICFFDISNLYYGNCIQRETLFITDPSVTGSDGKLRITLSDNGRGGLYRSDAESKNATWANVGNALYHEGVAIVKSPILTFFGKDLFELKCKGEQNVHVSIINIPLSAGTHNSSSNPQFKLLSASTAAADQNEKFVYIDSMCIHDENFNVIARTNFAQPIQKRVDDSMVIRFRMDF